MATNQKINELHVQDALKAIWATTNNSNIPTLEYIKTKVIELLDARIVERKAWENVEKILYQPPTPNV